MTQSTIAAGLRIPLACGSQTVLQLPIYRAEQIVASTINFNRANEKSIGVRQSGADEVGRRTAPKAFQKLIAASEPPSEAFASRGSDGQ